MNVHSISVSTSKSFMVITIEHDIEKPPCPVSMPGGNNKVCTCNDELKARIRNYLQNGGLFNPELMEHDKVRQLLMDVLEVL